MKHNSTKDAFRSVFQAENCSLIQQFPLSGEADVFRSFYLLWVCLGVSGQSTTSYFLKLCDVYWINLSVNLNNKTEGYRSISTDK